MQLDKAVGKARRLEKSGNFDAAAEVYAQLLRQFPQNPRIAAALEALLRENANPPLARLQALEAAYARRDYAGVLAGGRALAAAFPRSVTLHNILGAAELALRDAGAAEASFRRALAANPRDVDALGNLGVALKAQGRTDAALEVYAMAAAVAPDNANVKFNLANLLRQSGRREAALQAYEALAAARPGDAEPHFAMAAIRQELGQGAEAVADGLKALAADPGHGRAKALVIHQLGHFCDFEALAPLVPGIETLGIDGPPVEPFALLSIADAPALNLKRARAWSTRFPAAPALARTPRREGPIRVGYFSADFHNHATVYLMSQVFARHDRNAFEICLYSFGGKEGGAITERLRQKSSRYHDVHLLPDAAIAALARQDGLDVAVDLKGYTKDARPGIFASRAAPVQINYLGFPGSMGAPFIDYVVADPILVPDSHAGFYSEQPILLPDSYQPTDETRAIPVDGSSRADHGLPEAGFVFCAFNATYKIQPRDFALWMTILSAVEGSVLWLFRSNAAAEANLRKAAAGHGVDPARLVFAPSLPHLGHLARHRHADLFLDTFAYNAHTTASDALWAGLPLVTRIGEQFSARVAASILTAAGLPELITRSDAEYLALVLALAREPARLSALKDRLAATRTTAPLFDSRRYTRHLEAAYRATHRRHLDGLPPAPIRVSAEP
ncbi:tetratricopeptide repeat protein [Jiella sonneratiae]|uniref:protein O-GlcNAc transferase n=1 Tax=Jiella sonneratiae TaxID=2816856 RepID=A0ABS3IZZ4_9HYPH|nr:tetratricopeptide repeat protein [Jiella sonneratiae]MBO0902988.1 tetratricopeptide repeat protein [Jiella sonneratiae]